MHDRRSNGKVFRGSTALGQLKLRSQQHHKWSQDAQSATMTGGMLPSTQTKLEHLQSEKIAIKGLLRQAPTPDEAFERLGRQIRGPEDPPHSSNCRLRMRTEIVSNPIAVQNTRLENMQNLGFVFFRNSLKAPCVIS